MFQPNPFQPCLMFVSKDRSLPKVEHLNVASRGFAMTLLENFIIDWHFCKGQTLFHALPIRKLQIKRLYNIAPRTEYGTNLI